MTGRKGGGKREIEELAHAVVSRQLYTPQIFSGINVDKVQVRWHTLPVPKKTDRQLFLKQFWNHLQIPGARWVTWSKFHNKGPQMLSATVQNSVAMATRYLCIPDVKYRVHCTEFNETRKYSVAWSGAVIPNFTQIGQEISEIEAGIHSVWATPKILTKRTLPRILVKNF